MSICEFDLNRFALQFLYQNSRRQMMITHNDFNGNANFKKNYSSKIKSSFFNNFR